MGASQRQGFVDWSQRHRQNPSRQRLRAQAGPAGHSLRILPAIALVQQLQQAYHNLDLITAMTCLGKYSVNIVDDIGYMKLTDAETNVLFEFVAHRQQSGSLIINANQPLRCHIHRQHETVAAIDWLIHNATLIELQGNCCIEQHLKKAKPEAKKEST